MVMIKPPVFSLMQNFTVMNVYGMMVMHCSILFNTTIQYIKIQQHVIWQSPLLCRNVYTDILRRVANQNLMQSMAWNKSLLLVFFKTSLYVPLKLPYNIQSRNFCRTNKLKFSFIGLQQSTLAWSSK